jgi:DNA-binding CsgD family transcriptional regulator
MLFIYFKIKNIKNPDIKIILKILIYFQFIFYPFLILERIPFFLKILPYGFGLYPFFYFLTNLLWLIFVSKYLFFPEIKIDNNRTSLENFFNIYSISEREKEITQLLIEGLSYKEIGNKLFISYETVKTHINNIYRKTNSKSKIHLSRIIKKCSN